MPLRSLALVLVLYAAVSLAAGCASHPSAVDVPSPSIVGTWIWNVAESAPSAAQNPDLTKKYFSTLTFSPDGKYRAVSRLGGKTTVTNGTYRQAGSDVYIDTGKGASKAMEVRGSQLVASDKGEPMVMVFERKPER